MADNDADSSKELYKTTSDRLRNVYLAMITFVLVFFIAALIPYFNLLQERETSLSDSIIENITKLDRLLTDQEKILQTIQNYFDTPTLAAVDDYKKLNEYFRNLELVYSKAVASSSNVSISQLDIIPPTFLICNRDLHRDIDRWMTCSAETIADGLNKKIMLRYQNIGEKIIPLQEKAMNNLESFKLTASPLILDENKEIREKLPKEIDWDVWKQTIVNSSGRMINWVSNINNTLDFVLYNKSAVPWHILENPSRLQLTYSSTDEVDFKQILYSLNQSKNRIEKELKGLTERFEEINYPIIGKIPIAFTTAVIIYPAGVGVASLFCLHYLGQVISKRSHLHRILTKESKEFDQELYPLWIEPKKVEPKTSNFVRYVRLLLFVSVPLTVLLVTNSLISAIPIKGQSFFGISQALIMTTSCSIGYFLIIIGIIIVVLKLKEYKMPESPPPQKDPYDSEYFY